MLVWLQLVAMLSTDLQDAGLVDVEHSVRRIVDKWYVILGPLNNRLRFGRRTARDVSRFTRPDVLSLDVVLAEKWLVCICIQT
jgi:hypothetical protein